LDHCAKTTQKKLKGERKKERKEEEETLNYIS
jgi:hypothetical protein